MDHLTPTRSAVLLAGFTYFNGIILPYVTNSICGVPVINLFWSPIFGLGFYGLGFVMPLVMSRQALFLGGLLWPFMVAILIFFTARAVLRSGRRKGAFVLCFSLSFLVVWPDDAIPKRWKRVVPFYHNIMAAIY